ncbi:MAG: hypothetical protein Ct9H300mP14_12250 [Gammaproteobacteria bacterium]|nr:MAG: hypothetical protein Ct9H300mP14_12250 [Gammaproteobacteria bacterium]
MNDITAAEGLTLGVQTIHRRTEPSTGRWIPSLEDGRDVVELVDRLGFDSIWVGDHLAFSIPLLDPVVQLSQAAVFSNRLKIGTAVFLQPFVIQGRRPNRSRLGFTF